MKSFVPRCALMASVLSGLTGSLVSSSVIAQPPEQPAGQSPPAAPASEEENVGRVQIDVLNPDQAAEIPTLPETTVTARPFPREPLGENTIVSESRIETPRQASGSSVTVITSEEIQRRGARTLQEAINTVPGLDITARGGPGQTSSIFLRGANSAQTKVLLDGIPLNDPSSPTRAFDPANFVTDNIDRIEVIRGPQSTIYGSDAIGGVINIVTKRGQGSPSLRTLFEGGSFGTFNQQSTVSGGTDRYWYSFSGAWYRTDGFSAAAAGSENDGYENGTLSGRVGALLTDELDVDVVWRYTDADVDLDGFSAAPPFLPADSASNLDSENFFLRPQIRYTMFEGRLEHRIGYSFTSYKRDDLNGFQRSFDGDSHRFDYQALLKVIEGSDFNYTAVAGVDHIRETIQQDIISPGFPLGFPGEAGQFGSGVYLENRFGVQDTLFINASFRHDEFSRSGYADTWRTTGRYLVGDTGAALHGAIGTGFRAPALAEIAAGFGFNPTLQPEESFGWEVGLEQRFAEDRVVVDATYFRNDFDNLINFPPPFFTATNVNRAFAGGVELSGRVELTEDLFLTSTYTNTKTRDESTGAELLRRPRHKFNFGVSQFLLDHKANVSLTARFSGDRTDFGGTLDEYFVLDASAWYQITKKVRLFTRVDNITDESYQEVLGYNTAGLSAYGGAVIEFGGDDD